MPDRRVNWVEFGLEAWALGLFMVSACGFGVLLFHPASAMVRWIPAELARRALMGVAMGGTLILNVYSPWGRRSGAHSNPAVTLTFLRLGRIAPRDAAGYIAAQFTGGILGTLAAALLFRHWIADPSVNYAVTLPGIWGTAAAFAAELLISFGMMLLVLTAMGRERLAPYTGLLAGLLIAVYIALEAPISGMSMNPARSLGSALPAMRWDAIWIYFTAPLLGMLLAVEARRATGAGLRAACAKLHHDSRYRCIFCGHHGA